jgi:2-oxoglutarate ferredoxin oxidoreductase subunit beta
VAQALTKKEFQSDQEVRWCPGCGDYAILNAFLQVLPRLGIPREKFVVVSGIGCSSRFPYYVNTYGFHTIHGRAPAVATGIKLANPELQVWVATGDGDGLSIGGNHLLHALRRNVDIKIILFDNRIYGLTKGQYSPTSELGKINKSAPFGTVERPVNPVSFALACAATFVARSVDVYAKHLMDVLTAAAHHKGSAFIHVFQNCNVFNDKAFESFTERAVRDDANLFLEHGKPMIFGAKRNKGLRLRGTTVEIVEFEPDHPPSDLLVHDAHSPNPTLAFLLSRLGPPEFPVPMGIFRQIESPGFVEGLWAQVARDRALHGNKTPQESLAALLRAGDTWSVPESGGGDGADRR